MTSRSLSWVERGQWASLTQRLAQPGKSISVPVVPAASPPVQASQTLADKPVQALTPFVPPPGRVHARMEALVDWLDQGLQCSALFVTDENGLALLDRRTRPEFIAVSAMLMRALTKVAAGTGMDASRLSVRLGKAEVLHLVGVKTEWGHFAVGLLHSTNLNDTDLALAQRGLSDTMGADDE